MTRWLGDWRLLPELSHYTAGGPPEEGRYRITREGGDIAFAVDWVKDGAAQSVRFQAPADGSAVAFPGVDSFTVTAVDDATLDSAAFLAGARVAYARRRVSADGGLLSVYQENASPAGPIGIWQVYRRA